MYSRIKNSIWVADLIEKGSLSFFNCAVKYLLCMIDVFTKYFWVKPLADKKDKTVRDGFGGIVNGSKQPNKFGADQGKEFYYKIMQKFLDDNDVLMYLTYIEGTSVIAKRFMRTLKSKIYKKLKLLIVIPIVII